MNNENFKRSAAVLFFCALLATCASSQPRVVRATENTKEIHLVGGMATQVELPSDETVQSAVTGDPDLVEVGEAGNIINLRPRRNASGTTNLIVRSTNDDGSPKVYQYILNLKD